MKPLATLKHLSSKNADYGVAEQYLTFEHDEFTGKPILDENGRLVPRQDYRISSLNCGEEDFAVACMRANLRYGKNQQREDVKSHHYILSFDPRDGPDHGLTMDKAQALGERFCAEQFPGHQALVCTHPDGHNHSGNIHVHIVINSLRVAEVERKPYMDRASDTQAGAKPSIREQLRQPQGVQRMVDIEAKKAEGKGIGYQQWASVFNLKQIANSVNVYTEYGFSSPEELDAAVSAAFAAVRDSAASLKPKELALKEKKELRRQIIIYRNTKAVRDGLAAQKTPKARAAYRQEHEGDLLLSEATIRFFKANGITKLPTVKELTAEKRIGELNGIFKRLYEDSVSGRITDERFMELSTDYEQEQATLKARAAELQAELGQAQEAAVNVEKFMAVVRKYTSFEELTPTLLREFVEKIVVHECWKDEQGTRHQDIEIYYSFVGKVDLPDD